MSRSLKQTIAGLAFAVSALSLADMPQALAAGDDAGKILKAMSDYLGSQKVISATFNSDIEVITPDLQKIQFDSSGSFLISRPDMIKATRTGGYSDVEMLFDGKTLTVFGKNINSYAQIDAAGSIEQLIAGLRNHAVAIPGADLLLPDTYDKLMARVIDAKHVGLGVIDGVECEHLAFRTQDTDWQLWVQTGDKPIPRKYVITSKAIGEAPQYTLVIKDWKTDAAADPAMFAFTPPSGAKKVGPEALANLDEIPPGAPAKGQ